MPLDGGDSVTDAAAQEMDELFTILAAPRRRAILAYLQETEDTAIPVQHLAEELERMAVEEPHPPSRPHLANELHHLHLPKLADAEIIEYESGDNVVHYHSHDLAEEFLEIIRTHSSGR